MNPNYWIQLNFSGLIELPFKISWKPNTMIPTPENAVNVPKYKLWHALYKSFYSSLLYIDIAKRWRGFGVYYLIILIALVALPFSLRIMMNFNQFFLTQVLSPFESLPLLSIQQGDVKFDQKMPFLLKNPNVQVVALIDTSGTVTKIDEKYPYLSVLVTKNTIYFRLPDFNQFLGFKKTLTDNKIYSQSFSTIDDGIFDGKYWIKNSGINKMNILFQAFMFPCIALFYFGLYFCLLLIFTALAQLFVDTFWSLKLQFKDCCRLLAVAFTPQIIFYFSIRTMQLLIPGLGFYSLILLIVYSYFALFSVNKSMRALSSDTIL